MKSIVTIFNNNSLLFLIFEISDFSVLLIIFNSPIIPNYDRQGCIVTPLRV